MSVERFGRYSVELSSLDKVLFPGEGITKGDLIGYYRDVAELMLPHVKNRPLTLHRFPDGIEKDGFFQQACSDYFPDWIATRKTPRANSQSGSDSVEHVLCNNHATLVYLANQAVITLHGWLSRAPRIDRPDRLIFDLDPAGNDFDAVRRAARRVVELMQAIGMTPFVMTTGSSGLHVAAPLRGDAEFDDVRALARDLAGWLAGRHADEFTVEQRKNKRRGRIYLDIMRNARGQTAVVPYSVRPFPHAPVATPLSLDELGERKLQPRRWHIKNVLRRLARKNDPWADIGARATSLGSARKGLRGLEDE